MSVDFFHRMPYTECKKRNLSQAMEDVNCFVYGGERVYNVMDVARYITNYSIEIGRPVSNLK